MTSLSARCCVLFCDCFGGVLKILMPWLTTVITLQGVGFILAIAPYFSAGKNWLLREFFFRAGFNLVPISFIFGFSVFIISTLVFI